MRLATIVINTGNPQELVEFWTAVLQVEVAYAVPGDYFVWLKPQTDNGVSVAFQKVDDDPLPEQGRLHLDLQVGDRRAAIDRVVDLGGSVVAEHSFGDFSWTIVADPQGNRFCVAEPPPGN